VYFTTDDYSSFVSAGGGVVGESGIFPNSENLFIESVRLSVTGNEMTVVQLEKFDSTPKFKVGEKIYGYIINQDGDKQPVFCGYVHSISKRLSSRGQEIVFTCRGLKYYMKDLYTPLE